MFLFSLSPSCCSFVSKDANWGNCHLFIRLKFINCFGSTSDKATPFFAANLTRFY